MIWKIMFVFKIGTIWIKLYGNNPLGSEYIWIETTNLKYKEHILEENRKQNFQIEEINIKKLFFIHSVNIHASNAFSTTATLLGTEGLRLNVRVPVL